jgi:3-oxoacyl-[acyl-carrier-protein] synthase II
MSKHRVVVTGLGWITALGQDAAQSWRRLVNGENGIRPITYFDASQYGCRVAGEAGFEVPFDQTGIESLPVACWRRSARMFVQSAREAYADAGLPVESPAPERIGVAAGTSVNYVNMSLARYYFQFRRAQTPELDLARFAAAGRQPPHMFYRRQGDLIAASTATALGLGGPNFVVDTACAAGSYAIGEAFRLVQTGKADTMLAGGSCAIVSPFAILSFEILGALSRNPDPDAASRPFDRQRDGFVMGEGAGVVVLERYDRAVARGARMYGEIVGFGSSMNAQNLTDPSAGGISEAHAMQLALGEGGLAPEDIDYVAAHGTSTPKNDAIETAAIGRVFGPHAPRLMVSSNKGQLGHTISAAGACNLICTLKAIEESCVPPTAHLRNPDPVCNLDYVPNESRKATVRAALVNAFAFGGQNAVLAVKAI